MSAMTTLHNMEYLKDNSDKNRRVSYTGISSCGQTKRFCTHISKLKIDITQQIPEAIFAGIPLFFSFLSFFMSILLD